MAGSEVADSVSVRLGGCLVLGGGLCFLAQWPWEGIDISCLGVLTSKYTKCLLVLS